jgi:hypothetical protein
MGAFGRAQPAGTEIIIRADKNKSGKPLRVAVLQHDKTNGFFDQLYELEKFAKYYKVVPVSGSWVTLPDGKKVQGMRKALAQDPTLRQQIIDVVYRASADPEWEDKVLKGQVRPLDV